MFAILIDLILGFSIGLTLGFLGGGGSILTVPVLVYIVGLSPQAAVTASLMIVGANASIGAFFHRSQGTLNWRVALLFGGVGMAAAYLSSGLSRLVTPNVLMILFGLLMLVVGLWMLLNKTPANAAHADRGWPVTALSGAGVGVLTGFLGVGGGFLIVPALVMFVGLPIRQAVGTSLVVIAMNSLAGVLGHLSGEPVNLTIVGIFVVAGLLGSLVGARLARIIKPEQLRASFAGFVILLAIFLLYDNLHKLGFGGFSVSGFGLDAALLGGVLIGASATLLLAFTGRIAGISGLVAGAIMEPSRRMNWRWLFLLGLPLGAGIYEWWLAPTPTALTEFAPLAMVVGGLLVGFGTRMGNGCTSGHGVCGLGRLSVRSVVAVLTFLGAGIVTVYVIRHLLGFAL